MGTTVSGSRGKVVSDANVVPLIDILLVLLVIFVIIPHHQRGLTASLPQQASGPVEEQPPEPIVVQVASDGSIRLNGSVVRHDELRGRLEQVFALRAHRVAFLQGDRSLDFQVVAEVLDVMHVAGASPIGLVTSELEKNR
ncbi:MAG TPA: biopolymer transporter ExbD [Candidatus Acidoferrales bacterium]|jgi:biopolymer transport protein TolR|nr:biopolymer transporter ExbD [Candidatus Acidoferrales bacterium]